MTAPAQRVELVKMRNYLVVLDPVPGAQLQVGVQHVCLRHPLPAELLPSVHHIHGQLWAVHPVVYFC